MWKNKIYIQTDDWKFFAPQIQSSSRGSARGLYFPVRPTLISSLPSRSHWESRASKEVIKSVMAGSPLLARPGEHAGERGERGRLAAPLKAVQEDPGDQGSLKRRRGRRGSSVQVERCSRVQVGHQALRVEVRGREHPLQGRIITGFR